jgi:hypothetical protein
LYTHYDWSAQGATISGTTHDVTVVSVTPTSAGTYTVTLTASFDNTALSPLSCPATGTAVDCNLSGCTLGYWKNHPAVWDSYSDPIVAGTGGHPGMPAGTSPGQEFITTTSFYAYFALTRTVTGVPTSSTMLQALGLQGGGCVALARNGIAALLSKAAFGGGYPWSGTYSDLYTTIQIVLNGGTSSWTCSSLNDALNIANNNEFNGNCSALGAPGATPTVLNRSNSQDAVMNKLNVVAAPNPFYNKVKFFINSSEAGHVQLDIMNILGQKIANVYDGNIQANSVHEVEFTVPSSAPQNLMYLLRLGNQHVSGKLLRINQ